MTHSFSSLRPFAATLLAASLFFTSCKKELSNNTDNTLATDTQVATEDDAEADVVYDDVFDNVMGVDEEVGLGAGIGIFGAAQQSGDEGGVIQTTPNGVDSNRCFTVTRVPNTPGVFPKTVTIDFGTGCTGPDGRTRKGKIITVYTGRMIVPGSQATTTFVNYYVDSVHVEGTHTVKNNSTASVRIFTRSVVNGKLSKPSGNYTQWNATHTNTQTAGLGTPNFPLDDEFDITGSASGQNSRNGRILNWERLITDPLHKRFTCRWFVSGKLRITRNGNIGLLDYGNGTCDNLATITINGVTKTIRLH